MKGNGVRFSYGSASSKKLLHYEDININQSFGKGWGFRCYVNSQFSEYKDRSETLRFIEFQKSIFHGLSLCTAANLKYKKQDIDGKLGLLHVNKTRENYLQLFFCWDDLVYTERNDEGGRTTKNPIGISWLSRFSGEKWNIFTNGKLSTGFERDYKEKKSPDRSHLKRQTSEANGKFTWYFTEKTRIEAELNHYYFFEKQLFRQSAQDYSYSNEIFHGVLRYLVPVWTTSQLDFEMHYVNQYARAGGYKQYTYNRNEYIPAVFLKRSSEKYSVRIGYNGSFYNWDFDDYFNIKDDSKDDFVDKLNLGFTYHFSQTAHVYLSVSHVLQLDDFGGGNMRYMMFF